MSDFDTWFRDVTLIARLLGWTVEARKTLCRSSWKEYFDEGLSPAEAWSEEYGASR